MVNFGNLKSDEGLSQLNNHLAENSYLNGYVATAADMEVQKSVAQGKVSHDKYPHIARWYKHICTYAAEASSLPSDTVVTSSSKTDDDEDIDLFGSDDEEDDAEAERVKQERLAAYAAKKAKKPAVIAKSQILLDCKPWDDETDMKAMEKAVRTIELDGLVWGASKLNPLAYGIMKLSILATVEDAKVSVDDLVEKIEAFEDFVQSVDIGAFNKV